jgi:sugar transferase (PEP-CTERM system associated)
MVLLGLCEALVIFFSIYIGAELRFMGGAAELVMQDAIWPRSLLFTFVVMSSMTAMGMYWRNLREGDIWIFLFRVIISFLISIVVLSLMFYAFPSIMVGRGVMVLAILFSFVAVLLTRLVHYLLSDHEAMKKRVLVLGAGKNALQLEELRRKSDWHGFTLVGYVHIKGEHDLVDQEKIILAEKSFIDIVDEYQVDEIVVAIDDRRKSFPVDDILECKMSGVEVVDLVSFFERQTGRIKLDALHPSSMIFSDGFSNAVLKNYSKRIFDVIVSLILLAFAWPVMILTAISIYIESGWRGPIFYRQERVGKNGRLFNVLKFRSMRIDAEKDGAPQWAKKNDDRITKNGKVIRLLRIDELPQLLNVLKGEMSFVGPRPERPQFVSQLSAIIPFYNLRHKVNPGITGWAQISYAYGSSDKDAIEKLQYDLYYIKNYSLLFDIVILFQTAHTVLWGKGAR